MRERVPIGVEADGEIVSGRQVLGELCRKRLQILRRDGLGIEIDVVAPGLSLSAEPTTPWIGDRVKIITGE